MGEEDKEARPWMQGRPRCSLGITCDPEDQSCVLRDSHPSLLYQQFSPGDVQSFEGYSG